MPPKLVLVYVDSLRTDMLDLAVRSGAAPTFARLIERGVLVRDCVSSFPSVTPVASAEIATGTGSDRNWISAMNWYHRLEHRYVEYGSSFEATRAFGVFRALYDLVYNMNLAHLSPHAPTVFERLDDAGLRTASTPFLIYRGRHRHEVSLEGLARRGANVAGFRHATWGPAELFYGELYSSRRVPCRPTSIPGNRDDYSACCAAELAAEGLYDFLLLSLPDNDHHSHRHGPEATVASIAHADACLRRLVKAGGGLDGFLADHALIVMADHAQTPVHRGLPLAEALGERWSVLQPSEDHATSADLAVSPTARAANLYLLGDGDTRRHGEVRAAVEALDGIDLVCWLAAADGAPADRRAAATATAGAEAVVRRDGAELRFRPGGDLQDERGRRWSADGDLAAVDARVEDGVVLSDEYPDPFERVWSALAAPHAGDLLVSLSLGYECVDWGGTSHAGGGSHGSLHRGDSLGPLLFVNTGPGDAGAKRRWSLRDVAPVVLEHFGAG